MIDNIDIKYFVCNQEEEYIMIDDVRYKILNNTSEIIDYISNLDNYIIAMSQFAEEYYFNLNQIQYNDLNKNIIVFNDDTITAINPYLNNNLSFAIRKYKLEYIKNL